MYKPLSGRPCCRIGRIGAVGSMAWIWLFSSRARLPSPADRGKARRGRGPWHDHHCHAVLPTTPSSTQLCRMLPRDMSTESPSPRPPAFKTRADGRGGLVRVTLVGEPHDGRELYIDELELPAEIWTTPGEMRFEWWGRDIKADMERTAVGSDAAAPPV